MSILKKILTTGAPTTAAEIAAALETTRAERAAASIELAALADRRSDALVSGSDAAVDKVETEQTAMARKLDRINATIARLEIRHAEAEKAEAAAALEAQAAEVQRAVEKLAEIYGRIDTATADLQGLFDEAKPLVELVDRWNRAGHQIGRERVMFTPLDVIRQRTIGGIRI